MKKLALLAFVFAGLVWAGGRQKTVNVTTSAPWGVPPSGYSDGVNVNGADYVSCSVHGIDSTFSSGSVCWYWLPAQSISDTAIDSDAGWQLVGAAKQTASNVSDPDGGTLRRYSFQALKIGVPYGKMSCVACPLLGTADDAGTARFRVRTEAWIP